MPRRKMTKDERRTAAIEGLREALYHASVGYPYYGVPQAMRAALKVLREDAKPAPTRRVLLADLQADCLAKCRAALEAHGEHKLVDYIDYVVTG